MGEDLKRMIDDAIKAQRGGGEGKTYEPFPPAWKPAVGEIGEFLITKAVEVRNKQGGGTRVVRFVIDREGNQLVLPGSSGIMRELIRAKAGIGDYLYIKYEGEKPLKNPKPGYNSNFKAYTIVVIAADAFAKTGEKFAAAKPVPKPVATQTPAPLPSTPVATQAPTPTPAAVITGSTDKDVKRLADAVAKYPSGMKSETFQKLYRQITHDETKTTADALLDHADLFKMGEDKTGAETVQRVAPA